MDTQSNALVRKAYSVDEFCVSHSISRAFLYKLWNEGKGPRYMQVGTRRIISDEAGAAWRRDCETVDA
jgi:hypothetical protein